MARRIAHAGWAGDLRAGSGEASSGGERPGFELAVTGHDSDPSPGELRSIARRRARVTRDGRERRALEGWLVSRIRTQARERGRASANAAHAGHNGRTTLPRSKRKQIAECQDAAAR